MGGELQWVNLQEQWCYGACRGDYCGHVSQGVHDAKGAWLVVMLVLCGGTVIISHGMQQRFIRFSSAGLFKRGVRSIYYKDRQELFDATRMHCGTYESSVDAAYKLGMLDVLQGMGYPDSINQGFYVGRLQEQGIIVDSSEVRQKRIGMLLKECRETHGGYTDEELEE